MKNKIVILSIADICIYALSVTLFLVFKTSLLLTIWEITTFISAPVMLLLLLELLKIGRHAHPVFETLTIVFMACTTALTSLAHVVNIAVTRRLLAEGVLVPTYFQIGYWPSVEMAVDYLAWGFFMGLAFVAAAGALTEATGAAKGLRGLCLLCGGLCLAGFVGALFINENLWYLAPLGYGVGTLFLCAKMLRTATP